MRSLVGCNIVQLDGELREHGRASGEIRSRKLLYGQTDLSISAESGLRSPTAGRFGSDEYQREVHKPLLHETRRALPKAYL